jgi:hypothetical protein
MFHRKLGRLAWIMALALLLATIVPLQSGEPSAHADPDVTVVANPPVPAYVHPRILITPSELPALRTRLTDSAIGRRSMASIRAWIDYLLYDDPLDENERLLPLYNALVQGDPAVLANFPTSYAGYVPLVLNLEGFYALIEEDSAKAAEVAQALVTTVNILNDTIPTSTNLKGAFGSELFTLGYCYDFIYNYMTEAQRSTVRSYISSITTGKLLPVSTNPDPRLSRDNIAPVGTQWALLALAIEGETGYDPNVYSQAVKTMHTYFRYGLYDTGAPTEDMHYLNYGMSFGAQTLIAMDKRGDSLFNHPSFQNLGEMVRPLDRAVRLQIHHDRRYDERSGRTFAQLCVDEMAPSGRSGHRLHLAQPGSRRLYGHQAAQRLPDGRHVRTRLGWRRRYRSGAGGRSMGRGQLREPAHRHPCTVRPVGAPFAEKLHRQQPRAVHHPGQMGDGRHDNAFRDEHRPDWADAYAQQR